jgi:hypothetical protein
MSPQSWRNSSRLLEFRTFILDGFKKILEAYFCNHVVSAVNGRERLIDVCKGIGHSPLTFAAHEKWTFGDTK